MIKAALLCSAICTAFVVGDRTSVASQDKPAQVANPVRLHEVLKSFVGKQCYAIRFDKSDSWFISFEKQHAKAMNCKFDMLGVDFIRVSNKTGKRFIPFSSIKNINTD